MILRLEEIRSPATAELRRLTISSLHAADGIDCVFLPLGVDFPELRKFRLIHIGQFLTEVFEGVEKRFAVRGLLEAFTQGVDDRRGRTFGRKNTDPEIIFEIVAELLEGRHVWQRLDAL